MKSIKLDKEEKYKVVRSAVLGIKNHSRNYTARYDAWTKSARRYYRGTPK